MNKENCALKLVDEKILNLLEVGHSRWPKHVAGYADYNIIYLDLST